MELSLQSYGVALDLVRIFLIFSGAASIGFGGYKIYLLATDFVVFRRKMIKWALLILVGLFLLISPFGSNQPALVLNPNVNNEFIVNDREFVEPVPRVEQLDGFRPLGE